MEKRLLHLASRFKENGDRETDNVWLKTATPWVGDLAYFSVIYKPASRRLVERCLDELESPMELREFYAECNGAHLFGGQLSVYGIVPPGQLLNRSDPYSLPPFNLGQASQRWRNDADRYLPFGFYQYDGSQVCIDRSTSEAVLFGPEAKMTASRWMNFWQWLDAEFSRFSSFFDDQGRPLGPNSLVGPKEAS